MQSLIHFIIENQAHLSPDTQIRVSVGKYLSYPDILDTRQDKGTLLAIINNIKKNKSLTRDNGKVVNQKIYRYLDMEYIYSKNGESNCSRHEIDSLHIKNNQNGYHVVLEKKRTRKIEEFPCSLNYDDIIECTRIWYNINNLFDVCIVTEKGKDSIEHTRIELVVSCQNIYVDKLKSTLGNILEKINNGLTKKC